MSSIALLPNTHSKNSHSITAFFVLVSAITILSLIPSQSYALNPCTANPCPVGAIDNVTAGTTNTILYRDITSLDNSSATISIDRSVYRPGQFATVTISDFNANLDPAKIESITAKANTTTSGAASANVTLTETGTDTGVFVGSLGFTTGTTNGNIVQVGAGDKLSIRYTPEPATARFKAELDDVSSSGTAQISDFIVNDPNFATNNCFTPVVHPINVTLVGTAIGPTGYTVTMSYANALLEPPVPPQDTQLLQMYYKPVGGGWTLVTFNAFGDPGANDPVGMTITSDPGFLGNPPLTASGLFTIGFDNGCSGGGGGGIVSPGLLLDALAGLGGAAENVITPPSFGGGSYHYTDGLTVTQGTTKTTWDTSKYNQEIPKQIMTTGQHINMTFKTFDSYSSTAVTHMALYFIPHGQDMVTTNSIASIVYDKNSPVQITDPTHILSKGSASSNSVGKFQYTQFLFVPKKSYDKMSFLIRAWNDHMYSTDIRVHDAVITPPAPKVLPAGVIQFNNLNDLQAALEKDGFYKPTVLAHIHNANEVFDSSEGGQVYWLYDTINNSVKLVIADKNGTEVSSQESLLQPYTPEPKSDYGFMKFTTKQLNRQDIKQEQEACKEEADKAMHLAIENGLVVPSKW